VITKNLLKTEIDRVRNEYLEVLYNIIKALEPGETDHPETWGDFVKETYGCLSDDPIQRGDQGRLEIRGPIK